MVRSGFHGKLFYHSKWFSKDWQTFFIKALCSGTIVFQKKPEKRIF